MQYQVPQFIEIEDKIFGPLTFKQFVYIIGGSAICYFAYRFLPFFIAVLIILPVGSLSLALAFYKVNNRPFIVLMESAIRFILGKKLYIWQKTEKKPEENASKSLGIDAAKIMVPKLSNSKLKDLTWSLDINETIYSKDGGLQNKDEVHPQENGMSAFKGLATDMGKSGRSLRA